MPQIDTLVLALTLALAGCSSSGGETSDAETDPATGGSSGSTGSTATGSTGPVTPTGDAESTGPHVCPVDLCSELEASAVCEGDVNRVECIIDEHGCRVVGETSACEVGCVAGECCGQADGPACECVANPCLDGGLSEGWHCVDNHEVLCSEGIDCLQPLNGTPTDCGANTCAPETGTCGGCVPDECHSERAGTKLCATFDGTMLAGATCALVDGCMRETEIEACEELCVYGTGCDP